MTRNRLPLAMLLATVLAPGLLEAAEAPAGSAGGQCPELTGKTAVSLAELVDRALCANIDTRTAWQRTRTQAAQVGIARAAYYPSVNASASRSRDIGDRLPGSDPEQTRMGVSADWLLWDFGGRHANLKQTRATLQALQASYDARSQQVALSAVQAYYQRQASGAALDAARSSVAAAEETAKAAHQRVVVGAGTREDELQSATALAQARLTEIQRQGEQASADGQLAVVAGYPASTSIRLDHSLPAPEASPAPPLLDSLLKQAMDLRPERLAQQRNINAAESDLDRIAAQSLPRISVSASRGDSRDSDGRSDTGQVALNASLPLFTGFQQHYQERAAESQIEQQKLELQRIEQQVSLDVWLAWQALNTARSRVDASDSLLASAQESSRAALARYRAGLGSLLNVLNAQSSLADARQQQARARYDWAAARLQLAQASGVLVRNPENILVTPTAQEPRP